ncbi:ankyrin repeat domain-containing protein [bacterium]|nr:MAG: ankyrin repeat domain-containing protein [bacterium]
MFSIIFDCFDKFNNRYTSCQRKPFQDYPLRTAVLTDNFEELKALIANGADVHITTKNGRTLLHCATLLGNLECLRELLKHHNNINAQDHQGNTPLHLATQIDNFAYRNTNCIELLLESGAELNAINHAGETPLLCAVSSGWVQAAQLLIKSGANTTIKTVTDQTITSIALKSNNEEMKLLLLATGRRKSIQKKNENRRKTSKSLPNLRDLQGWMK